MKRLDADDFIDALDSVTWYNGLAEYVMAWKTIYTKPFATKDPVMERLSDLDEEERSQLEVIWMIAVMLFGDYGTSPRSGWIEDIDGFYTFIDRITETHRYSERIHGEDETI